MLLLSPHRWHDLSHKDMTTKVYKQWCDTGKKRVFSATPVTRTVASEALQGTSVEDSHRNHKNIITKKHQTLKLFDFSSPVSFGFSHDRMSIESISSSSILDRKKNGWAWTRTLPPGGEVSYVPIWRYHPGKCRINQELHTQIITITFTFTLSSIFKLN